MLMILILILESYWKADLALPIRAFTSISVPLCLSMMLPRQMKLSTSSNALPSSVMGAVLAVLTFKTLDQANIVVCNSARLFLQLLLGVGEQVKVVGKDSDQLE